MKSFSLRRRGTSDPGLVDRSAPNGKSVDRHPDEWHALAHPLLSPADGRVELRELVEQVVGALAARGSLDEAHAGVVDHLIEDRRAQMEEHIRQHYRTRVATQASLTRRARKNQELASHELSALRAQRLEALQDRNYWRDVLLGRSVGDPPSSVMWVPGDVASAPERPASMPRREVDTSGLHGDSSRGRAVRP